MQEYQTIQVVVFIAYLLALIYTAIRILLDTESTPKTLAYLLLIFLFPLIGMLIYFSFGINYRHQRSSSKGAQSQRIIDEAFQKEIKNETDALLQTHQEEIAHLTAMVHFLGGIEKEHLCPGYFKLVVNGEEKFPEVIKTLETASHFIHMEYYDWENDIRGNEIKDVLLRKVKEGVKVRVLYDDYASRAIRRNIVKELKSGGVEIYPQIKVKLKQFANRVNHRDHRKIIIVDGIFGFVGGINTSDRYDNSIDTGLYWRDTHMMITGPLVGNLQRHFIVSWNSSAP